MAAAPATGPTPARPSPPAWGSPQRRAQSGHCRRSGDVVVVAQRADGVAERRLGVAAGLARGALHLGELVGQLLSLGIRHLAEPLLELVEVLLGLLGVTRGVA